VAYVEDGRCRLVSRNRNAFKTFEPLAEAIAQDLSGRSAILDGEIVHPGPDGRPLFLCADAAAAAIMVLKDSLTAWKSHSTLIRASRTENRTTPRRNPRVGFLLCSFSGMLFVLRRLTRGQCAWGLYIRT
jgi:hypothetical protein